MTTTSIFGTEPRPAVGPQPPTRLPDGRLRCPRCQTSLSAHVPPRCPECWQELAEEKSDEEEIPF
jgi:predicted amidophosphoribosyltransferase